MNRKTFLGIILGLPLAIKALARGESRAVKYEGESSILPIGNVLPAGYSVTTTNKPRSDGTLEQEIVIFDPRTNETKTTGYLWVEGTRYTLSNSIVKRPALLLDLNAPFLK